MKKLIMLAATALAFFGCSLEKPYKTIGNVDGFDVIVVDSCEYIYHKQFCGQGGIGVMAHKGNCKFCADRRKEEANDERQTTEVSDTL